MEVGTLLISLVFSDGSGLDCFEVIGSGSIALTSVPIPIHVKRIKSVSVDPPKYNRIVEDVKKSPCRNYDESIRKEVAILTFASFFIFSECLKICSQFKKDTFAFTVVLGNFK